jgi:hypothetical protein
MTALWLRVRSRVVSRRLLCTSSLDADSSLPENLRYRRQFRPALLYKNAQSRFESNGLGDTMIRHVRGRTVYWLPQGSPARALLSVTTLLLIGWLCINRTTRLTACAGRGPNQRHAGSAEPRAGLSGTLGHDAAVPRKIRLAGEQRAYRRRHRS